MPTWSCFRCQTVTQTKTARPPKGWTNTRMGHICATCWDKAYRIIAVTLPVMGVDWEASDWHPPLIPADERFRMDMMLAFRRGTNCYNWAFRQLLASDFVRTDCMDGPPKQPKVDLYALYNHSGQPAGNLAAQTRSALFRMAASEYARHRRRALWDHKEGIPLKRFPAPYPVHNQGWSTCSLYKHDDLDTATLCTRFARQQSAAPGITFRLHGEDHGPRWTVRLGAGKRRFGSALHWFNWLRDQHGDESSLACPFRAELNLLTQPCQAGDDGVYMFFKRPGGGQAIPQRLMAKLVMYIPRGEPRQATGVLDLHTNAQTFLLAQHDGRIVHPWILNEDQMLRRFAELRRAHAEHHASNQRFREDMKLERRTHIGSRVQMLDCQCGRCQRHHRRMKTWIDQIAAMCANYCVRRKLFALSYDDRDRGWTESFPWFQLQTSLQAACDRRGVAFFASGEAVETAEEVQSATTY
jgi:hypothetical protein